MQTVQRVLSPLCGETLFRFKVLLSVDYLIIYKTLINKYITFLSHLYILNSKCYGHFIANSLYLLKQV